MKLWLFPAYFYYRSLPHRFPRPEIHSILIDLSLNIFYSTPMDKAPSIKHVLSEALTLLFNSDNEDAIGEALRLLLNFFNVDWVYIARFEKDRRIACFL